jgi:two-component system NtrC family response regulator
MVLSDESHLVDICMNGRAGLDAIFKGQYDVVLLDLKLPDVGGMEILSTIRLFIPAGK